MALVPPKKATWYCTPQWRIQGRGQGGPGPPPLFLDQTVRPEGPKKVVLGGRPPLSKGLDNRPPPPHLKVGGGGGGLAPQSFAPSQNSRQNHRSCEQKSYPTWF